MEFHALRSHPAFIPAVAFAFLAGLMLFLPMAFTVQDGANNSASGALPTATVQRSSVVVNPSPVETTKTRGSVISINDVGTRRVLSIRVGEAGSARIAKVAVARGTRIIDARDGVAQFASMDELNAGLLVTITTNADKPLQTGDVVEQIRIVDATEQTEVEPLGF